MDHKIGFWRDELQKNIEGLREANEARERIRTTGYVGNAITTSLKEVIQLPEVANAFGYIKVGNALSAELTNRLHPEAILHLDLAKRPHLVVLGDAYSANVLVVAHSGSVSPPPAVVRAWGEPGQKMSCACGDLTPSSSLGLDFSGRSRPATPTYPPGYVAPPREATPYNAVVALQAEARPHRFLPAVQMPGELSGPPPSHNMNERSFAADIGKQVGQMAVAAAAVEHIREETQKLSDEVTPRPTSFGR